jgi:hypothetical protein
LFLWTNEWWFADCKKFKGNIKNSYRVILKLEIDDRWFDDPRQKFYPRTTYYGWITMQFFEYIQMMLKLSAEWEGFQIPFFAGRFKSGNLNWGITREGIMTDWENKRFLCSIILLTDMNHSKKLLKLFQFLSTQMIDCC